MTKKLERLKKSLEKKESEFNDKLSAHFADVKCANGQPLNDKKDGHKTLHRWERSDQQLGRLQDGIEKTKQAIEIEKSKISQCNSVIAQLPECITDLIEDGTLIQWRKNPTFFFVKGVDKARIIYKNNIVMHKYLTSIVDKNQRAVFAQVYNSLYNILKNEK